ncbi:PAS domain S-box protein [Pseudomonas entomophila]|jgi:PAS domain S-box-containing protein|uniref:two-component system sensor histidine kinase NtrB n=1 Tax=Pseudomonas entomophila TaxID=312306 RepID=UPI0015E29BC8|nr:PAS domain S-box protein [Pseudomonas entomophila]MBA1192767.1 PAS domain S-box protein [Pseudomonas entomophila]
MVSGDRLDSGHDQTNAYEQLVQAVIDYAIYRLDPSGRVVSWNKGAQRIKGYAADEVVGQHFSLFFTEQDCAQGRPDTLLQRALREGVSQDEGWRVRKDGTRFWALVALDVIRDEHGAIVGLAKVTRDITDRQEAAAQLDAMRAQLFQAQKLEALGQLTGGLAHDFNNLLTIILGSARLALTHQDPARIGMLLEHIVAAGERGTQLTQQLLSFARHRQLEVTAIAPAAVIESTHGLIGQALPEGITLAQAVQPGLPLIEVDVGQLQMALLNLVFNARDAIDGQGTISLRADRVALHGEPDGLQGDYVKFDVCDTGHGIEPAVMTRVFEPFFTTKAFGKGTGLGLSQVYGFSKQSQGTVHVRSTLGEGTCMSLFLPVWTGQFDATGHRSRT